MSNHSSDSEATGWTLVDQHGEVESGNESSEGSVDFVKVEDKSVSFHRRMSQRSSQSLIDSESDDPDHSAESQPQLSDNDNSKPSEELDLNSTNTDESDELLKTELVTPVQESQFPEEGVKEDAADESELNLSSSASDPRVMEVEDSKETESFSCSPELLMVSDDHAEDAGDEAVETLGAVGGVEVETSPENSNADALLAILKQKLMESSLHSNGNYGDRHSDTDSDFVRIDPNMVDENDAPNVMHASGSSVSSNFSFLRNRRQQPRNEDEDSIPGDVDDRCESDLSAPDYSSDSELNGDALLVPGGPVIRQYQHQPNNNLNYVLTIVMLSVIAAAIGLGIGHAIGTAREAYLQTQLRENQVVRLKTLQDDLVSCWKQNDAMDDKIAELGSDNNMMNEETELWKGKYRSTLVQIDELEDTIRDLKKAIEKNEERHKQDKADWQAEFKVLRKAKLSVEQQLLEIDSEKSKLEELTTENQQLNDKLNAANEALRTAQEEFSVLKEKGIASCKQEYEDKLATLQAEVQRLQIVQENDKEMNEKTMMMYNTMRTELRGIRQQQAQKDESIQQYQTELSRLQSELNALRESVKAEEEKGALETSHEVQRLRTEISALEQKQTQAAKQRLQMLSMVVQDCVLRVQTLEHNITAVENKMSEDVKTLEKLEENTNALTQQLTDIRTVTATLALEVEDQGRKVTFVSESVSRIFMSSKRPEQMDTDVEKLNQDLKPLDVALKEYDDTADSQITEAKTIQVKYQLKRDELLLMADGLDYPLVFKRFLVEVNRVRDLRDELKTFQVADEDLETLQQMKSTLQNLLNGVLQELELEATALAVDNMEYRRKIVGKAQILKARYQQLPEEVDVIMASILSVKEQIAVYQRDVQTAREQLGVISQEISQDVTHYKEQINVLETENQDLRRQVGKMKYTSVPVGMDGETTQTPTEDEFKKKLADLEQKFQTEKGRADMWQSLFMKEKQNAEAPGFFTCMRVLATYFSVNVTELKGAFQDPAFQEFSNTVHNQWENIQSTINITAVWEQFENFTKSEEFENYFDKAKSTYGTVQDTVSEKLEKIYNFTKSDVFQEMVNSTKDSFSEFSQSVADNVADLKKYAESDNFKGYLNKTKDTMAAVTERIASTWEQLRNLTNKMMNKESDSNQKKGSDTKTKTGNTKINKKQQEKEGKKMARKKRQQAKLGKKHQRQENRKMRRAEKHQMKVEKQEKRKEHRARKKVEKQEKRKDRINEKKNRNSFKNKEYKRNKQDAEYHTHNEQPHQPRRGEPHQHHHEHKRNPHQSSSSPSTTSPYSQDDKEKLKDLEKLKKRVSHLNEKIVDKMNGDDIEDIYEDFEEFQDDFYKTETSKDSVFPWLSCQLKWWKWLFHDRKVMDHRSSESATKGCETQLMNWQNKYQEHHRWGHRDPYKYRPLRNRKGKSYKPSEDKKCNATKWENGAESSSEWYFKKHKAEEKHVNGDWYAKRMNKRESYHHHDSPEWLFRRHEDREYHHHPTDWVFKRASEREYERQRPDNWYLRRGHGKRYRCYDF